MLCNCVETHKEKSAKYWPEEVGHPLPLHSPLLSTPSLLSSSSSLLLPPLLRTLSQVGDTLLLGESREGVDLEVTVTLSLILFLTIIIDTTIKVFQNAEI